MARHSQIDQKAVVDLVAKSGELRAELVKQAAMMAHRANSSLTRRQSYPDYGVGDYTHRSGIPGTTVFTRSNHAKHSNAKHNTLLKVLGGGGGGGGNAGGGAQHRKPVGKRNRKK